MKIIIFILFLTNNKYYIYENTQINFNYFRDSIIYNPIKEEKITKFQLGFYFKLDEIKSSFCTFLSITDFNDFNINFKIKKDENLIYINDSNRSQSLKNSIHFILILVEFINNKIRIILILDNTQYNIYSNPVFILDKNLDYIDFSSLKFILGGDKFLNKNQFIGSFNNLSLITVDDLFNNNNINYLKNGNSIALIFINFRESIKSSNYFNNKIENGFMGIINGKSIKSDENDLLIEEVIDNSDYFYSNVFFKNFNSYLNLSNQIIDYISSKNYRSFSFFSTINIEYINKSLCSNNRFFIYKLNDINFIIELINFDYNENNLEISFKTNISNNYTTKNNSNTLFFLRFNDMYNNNFKLFYKYNNNNNIFENNFDKIINFSNNMIHKMGFLEYNNWCSIKLNRLNIKIFEIIFLQGAAEIKENDNVISFINQEKLFLNCGIIFPLSRVDNNTNCNSALNNNFKFQIPNCNLYNNIKNECIKCIENYYLKNNECIYDKFNKNNDINLSWNCFDNNLKNYSTTHEMLKINFELKLFYFYVFYTTQIINLNTNFIVNLNSIKTDSIYNKNVLNDFFYFYKGKPSLNPNDFNFSNNLNINFEIKSKICNYKLNSYFILNENCINLTGYNNYFPILSEFGLFKCKNLNEKESNYYLSKNKLLIKCNINCKECINYDTCIKCNDNYFLWDHNCYKNNNQNCLIPKNFDRCNVCKNDKPKYQINNNSFSCFKSCYNNCLTCLSPFSNKCTSCISDQKYYPELMICKNQLICDDGYDFYDDNNKICNTYCLKKNLNNECISCIKNYYLREDNNICTKFISNNNSNIFLDYNHLDINNKPFIGFCSENCLSCVDEKNKCISCKNQKKILLENNDCLEKCPEYYTENNNFECIKCKKFCINCDLNKCNKCLEGFYILNNECVEKCPENYFIFENTCLLCINNIENCYKCRNKIFCDKCNTNYYIKNGSCSDCNKLGFYKKNDLCLKCNLNCLSCENEPYNCSSCKNGFKLKIFNNYKICLKNCENNYFFDINDNNCKTCEKCSFCYENNHQNCIDCKKCKNKCKVNILYNLDGLYIIKEDNNIILNSNYLIPNLPKNNIKIIENGLLYEFYEEFLLEIDLKLDIWLINSSKNCYDLTLNNKKIIRKKLKCEINSIKIDKNNIIKIENNFLLKKDFEIILNPYNSKFKIKNNLLNYNKISNLKSEFYFNITNNYYKNDYNVNLFIDKSYLKEESFCLIDNIKSNFSIYFDNNSFNFDFYKIINNLTLSKETLFNIENIENKSEDFKSASKYSFTLLLLFSSFTGLMNLLTQIFQLIYFIEILNLIPISYGSIINTFLKYFSLSLNTEINLNTLLEIESNYLKSFYSNKFLINPKLYEIEWLDITIISLENFYIIILYIIKLFYNIIDKYFSINDNIKYKYIKYKKVFDKNKYKKKLNISIFKGRNLKITDIKKFNKKRNKFINEIDSIIFSLIEGLKINYFVIIIIYSYTLIDFQFSLNYLKILFLYIINFLLLSKYFWDLINALFYKNNKKIKNKYYKSILWYSIKEKRFNLYHQLITTLRDFLIVIIVLEINYRYQIHLIIILIIQIFYIIYLFFIRLKKNKNFILKLRVEEICNLFLLVNISIYHYFINNNVVKYFFIVIYIFLFIFKFFGLIYSIWKYIFGWIVFIKNKILLKLSKLKKKKKIKSNIK